MPQLPWKKWFPQDWLSDPRLARCSPATRGIWADAVSSMMLFGEDHITGSDAYLARVCRCSEADIQVAHDELLASKTGDVSIQNEYKIWTCRRIHRELSISEIRKEAVNKRWHKGHTKRSTKAIQHSSKKSDTSSASASLSSSVLVFKRRPKNLEEVLRYATQLGISKSDANAFFDSMEAGGWTRNKTPLRDWEAHLRSYRSNGWLASQKNGNGQKATTFQKQKERAPIYDKLPEKRDVTEEELVAQRKIVREASEKLKGELNR